MRTKGINLNETRLEQAPANKSAGLYTSPQVEVIEIELTQNILTGSTQKGFGLPNYDDGGDAW